MSGELHGFRDFSASLFHCTHSPPQLRRWASQFGAAAKPRQDPPSLYHEKEHQRGKGVLHARVQGRPGCVLRVRRGYEGERRGTWELFTPLHADAQ